MTFAKINVRKQHARCIANMGKVIATCVDNMVLEFTSYVERSYKFKKKNAVQKYQFLNLDLGQL